MAQRVSSSFTPELAARAIAAEIKPLGLEQRPLEACTHRILRQDVYPERDNPPFDRVCMDGIAISHAAFERGTRRFVVETSLQAGAPPVALRESCNAVEVMTGAVLPVGADCVIPLEEFDLDGRGVVLKPNARSGVFRNVQRQGEDGALDVAMLTTGTRLLAPELGIIASAGLASVSVARTPRFMIVSTGDELVAPGNPIAVYQVRRSNAYSMIGALRSRGYDAVANDHIADDEQSLSDRLSQHLEQQDVLILSGGVSAGKFDLVPKLLKQIGVREVFAHVAQRPGAPMWFGVGPRGQLVFGLPGNPVATLVCLIRFVIPAATRLMGGNEQLPERVALAAPVDRGRPMTYFVPVALDAGPDGQPGVVPKLTNGPGDFLRLAGSVGFLELPPGPGGFPVGFVAPLYRW